MREGMRVPTLQQAGLLVRRLIDRIVHEDLPGDVREARIEAARDQNAPIVKANGHRVALKHQVLRHKLFRPAVLGEVVL